jgi:PKD repeat protein
VGLLFFVLLGCGIWPVALPLETIQITFGPGGATVGAAITFQANPPVDPNSVLGYHWDFGDESDSDGEMVSHIFRLACTYTVTLTLTYDNRLSQLLATNLNGQTQDASNLIFTKTVVIGNGEGSTPGWPSPNFSVTCR